MMKITVIQRNYIIADLDYNFAKIRQAIIDHQAADLIVFSELCLIGYYPHDLLLYEELLEKQNLLITKIQKLTEQYQNAVVIGVASAVPKVKKFHNSALVIDRGTLIFKYDKKLIPGYSVFDETRHFIPGESYPIFKFKDRRFAVFICEDIWFGNHQGYLRNPVESLINQKIEAVITINASPSMLGKFTQRLEIARKIARMAHAPVVYATQVGGYDELVYDGASFIVDQNEKLIALAPSFAEGDITVNLDALPQKVLPLPYPSREAMILQQLLLGLKDYVHKCGFQGIVVGSSGGIDSALTLAIATLALGKENVRAITMPSPFSSIGSVEDSKALCQNLGISLYTRPISAEFQQSCRDFESTFGRPPKPLTKENMQARIRGRIVMEYANDMGVLMLTTGNKSELAVGYATLYGDMCGALNCIGDLYKQDVYRLSDYINTHYGHPIPQSILDKVPSAELSENQKDSDHLPPYLQLDALLQLYLEKDLLSDEAITQLEKIADQIDTKEQKRIYRMIEQNEFKRKQAPQVLCVHRRPFGIGRRIPVTSAFQKHC